jgi:polysaccharide deacetylase family protein (PEP-CTERM system associated)
MARVSRFKAGLAVVAASGLIALHYWTLWSGALPRLLEMLSFAVLCFLLSWLLPLVRPHTIRRTPALLPAPAPRVQVKPAIELTLAAPSHIRPVCNAFSIDLEDYFHTEVASQAVDFSNWDGMPSRITSSVMRLLDLLDEHQTKSTVFVLGWVAKKNPVLVRHVAERGHEIACHSYRHKAVFCHDRQSFYQDTLMARQAIEDATGHRVQGYRAPSFSMTPGTEWAFDVLSELGFVYDSSIHPIRHKFYGNAGGRRYPYVVSASGLIEIPIATWRLAGSNLPIGGGAYLRMLPYAYIRAGLSHVNDRECQPATLYVHPWEIDSFQPPLGLSWKSHMRQNWGVQTMEGRLTHLLSHFRFAPISQVYAHLLLPAKPVLPFPASSEAALLLSIAN